MVSDESLRLLIRGKLANGVLPGQDCTKVFGGVSNGETCDGCGEIIGKTELVMDCIGEHYPKTQGCEGAGRVGFTWPTIRPCRN
jgi:hypothetical protein